MSPSAVSPFNQKIRIKALRILAILLLPLALFIHPVMAGHVSGEVFEQIGIVLVVAGIVGRFWATLYIGGHKNACVMDKGPYSVCRHPLYLFSTMAVLGFCLMVQSIVFAGLFAGVVFIVLSLTAAREEAYLRSVFGREYDVYAARTPRILPNPFLFRTTPEIRVNVAVLRTNFFDALVFLALIPLAESLEEMRGSFGFYQLWLY